MFKGHKNVRLGETLREDSEQNQVGRDGQDNGYNAHTSLLLQLHGLHREADHNLNSDHLRPSRKSADRERILHSGCLLQHHAVLHNLHDAAWNAVPGRGRCFHQTDTGGLKWEVFRTWN